MRIQHAFAALSLLGSLASAQVIEELRIAEMQSGFGANLANGAQFGGDLAALGDLDGDGVGDLAVSAPHDPDGGPAAGAVWILFLEDDGSVKSYQKINATQGGFGGALGAGYFFGSAVAALGDLDGDGVRDLAVGSDGDGQAGFRRGAVWILFLRTDGTVKAETKIASGLNGFTAVLENSDRFGSALAEVGDIDGDGRVELAVGALGDDDGEIDAGAVYLLSLDSNGSVFHESKISATSGGFTATFAAGDEFGGGLGALGDFDLDGVEDLAVGMIRFKTPEDDSGAVHILFLNANGSVKSSKRISKGTSGFTPNPASALFGSSIALGEDVDGDGVRDLLVGSPAWKSADAILTGSLWVIYMKADGTAKGNLQVATNAVGFVGPLLGGDYFGKGLALVDDFDGNGLGDVAIGSLGADIGGLDAGALWILSLREGTAVNTAFAERTAANNRAGAFLLVTSGMGFTPPRIGGTTRLQVDTALMVGHDQALFFAFDGKITLPIPNGWTLLCIDSGLGVGEILTGNGTIVDQTAQQKANYSLVIPNNGALVGFEFTTQALLLDSTGTNRYAVANAWDITVGL